jgi:CHAT domain-containing protein/Tfp pilus assembly protein PilF
VIALLIGLLLPPSFLTTAKSTGQGESKSAQGEIRQLVIGQPIDREITSGETHQYALRLASGDYIRVELEEGVNDLGLTIVDPDGRSLVVSNNSATSVESASVVAEREGEFRVVTRLAEKTGVVSRYQVRIMEWRKATAQDRDCARARQAFEEGKRLYAQRTPESLRGAVGKFEESLAIHKAAGDRRGEACDLYHLGLTEDLQNDRKKSLEYLQQALPLFQALGDRKAQSRALVEIGSNLNALDQKQQALEYFNQALSLTRELGDRFYEGYTIASISLTYGAMGDRQLANEYQRQAMEIRRSLGDRRGEAISLAGIGGNYEAMGDKQKALEYLHRALPLLRAEGETQAEAHTLYQIGAIYESLNDKRKAVEYFNQSLAIRKKVGHRRGEAALNNDLGNIYAGLGDYQQSLTHYQQSLVRYQEQKDFPSIARLLRNIGLVYDRMGDGRNAAEYFKRALPLFRLGADRQTHARLLANLGKVLSETGDYEEALGYLNESVKIFRNLESRFFELYALYWIAYAERGRGNLAESRARIEEALDKIERIRRSFYEPELRVTGFTKAQDFYELEIDLLAQLGEKRPDKNLVAVALENSERARARTMLELLAESQIEIREGVSQELRRREQESQSRLSSIQGQIIQAHLQPKTDPRRIAALQDELKQADAEREEMERDIHRLHPRYAEIRYPSPLRAEAIQGLLDSQTALLEYFVGQENSFLFVVTKEDSAVYRLPKGETIGQLAQEFRAALRTPGRREFGAYARTAHRLYQTLIAPAADALAGKQRLLIIPDGALYYVPFEALLVKGADGAGDPEYLLKRWAVGYAPSASVVASLRQNTRPAADATATRFLAFADPLYEASGRSEIAGKKPAPNSTTDNTVAFNARGLFDDDAQWELTRLTHSRREVEGIARLYRPQASALYLGRDAKEENVKGSGALATARRIHFATHGMVNERQPQYSGLVLTLDDDPREDGLLQVYEIFNLKLQADLVVLSACQTGLGQQFRGEGMIGLTRAFMYAGAPSVVVSLWSVADVSTADLMVAFYQHLDRAEDKADALRAAKLELMRNPRYAHPYYWAPFVLVGETR